MTSTLGQIKKKVRRLTASPSPAQLSDSDIEDYVDQFYEYDLPAHLKLWELRKKYTFFTEPGEDRYTFDKAAVKNFQNPLYIDGEQSWYTQSESEFFYTYTKQNFAQDLGSGDGSATFAGTITRTPIVKRSVSIIAIDTNGDQLVAIDAPDDGTPTQQWRNGNNQTLELLTGTINYDTGAISVTFPSAIPTTSTVTARMVTTQQGKPRAMLYNHDYLTLRPVPDSAYRVEIDTYQRPTDLLDSDDDNPDLGQWWQLIAFGAAIKVLQDRQDVESIKNIAPFYEEQKELVLNRTIQQQTQQRTPTIYSGQSGVSPYNSSWTWGV